MSLFPAQAVFGKSLWNSGRDIASTLRSEATAEDGLRCPHPRNGGRNEPRRHALTWPACDQSCQRAAVPATNGRAKFPDLIRVSSNFGSPMRQPATKSKPAPARAPAPVTARPRFPAWLMAVLLVLVTIALYWPAMRHDFVNYDDNLVRHLRMFTSKTD